MPACDPQTFLNITAERFACIVKQAEESSGLLLEGASGEAKAKGIHIQWEFDALAETLHHRVPGEAFLRAMRINCGAGRTAREQLRVA